MTAHAVSELGEIVALDLPAIGSKLARSQSCGAIESMKTVSELVAPVSGSVAERNEAVLTDPSLVNADPYGGGWMFAVRLADGSEMEALLTGPEYDAGL